MSYLIHHGVKGQQWGVQNGPPYPLDSGSPSKQDKKYAKSRVKALNKATKKYSKIHVKGQQLYAKAVQKNTKKSWKKLKKYTTKKTIPAETFYKNLANEVLNDQKIKDANLTVSYNFITDRYKVKIAK